MSDSEKIIDGTKVANDIKNEVKKELEVWEKDLKRKVQLAMIYTSDGSGAIAKLYHKVRLLKQII